jgi:nickel-dependent lactate racemase
MRIKLPYGQKKSELKLQQKNFLGMLEPKKVSPVHDPDTEVRRALAEPITGPRLLDRVRPNNKILIVVSDISRPSPSHILLPPVLEELQAAGIEDKDITIVFALGIHRHQTEMEKIRLVGGHIYQRYRCIEHNTDDCVYAGTTSLGIRAEILKEAMQADYIIATGNIEFHYFAGYSGGAKAVAPGLCSRATASANHSRFMHPGCRPGNIEGNSLRHELEEIADMAGVDFIVNAVLNGKKELLRVVAGDVRAAHRKGAQFLDRTARRIIDRQADIVVVSPGGYPKDIDLYQAHKAMEHALPALKKNGILILAGQCAEGLGVPAFADVFDANPRPQDLAEELDHHFVQGRHIACRIAAIHLKTPVYLVSGLPERTRNKLFFPQFTSIQTALDQALAEKGADSSVWIIPYGISVVPDYQPVSKRENNSS